MNPAAGTVSPATTLGVPGYLFSDLHDPDRLASLYERFCEDVEAADPELWRRWEAYRSAPDAPRPPIALSNLLVAMAAQVSRFVTRLFQIQPSVEALTALTREQDDLFRFKVDFVRRRVVPLVKAGAPVTSTPEDEAAIAALIAGAPGASDSHDTELAVARAGCLLLDAEKAGGSVVSQIDSLKRWCAARLRDRAYRKWAIFRFPETLDYWRLVDVQRPRPDLPECMAGPDDRLRRRDGFRLTDARMRPRDVLSEIHYCVLCHERDKDSCSKGLQKNGTFAVNPLGVELAGCP
ncbi:MAG TPA: hypothetical protein VGP84_12415, partial [Gemmatimonadaceae bacterium]|nr:hypothetical protein [Gemmatimonadaceae bacterium]